VNPSGAGFGLLETSNSMDFSKVTSELISTQEGSSTEAIGLFVTLEARAGKEADAEAFLKSAQPLALDEKGTLKWYAIKLGPGSSASSTPSPMKGAAMPT